MSKTKNRDAIRASLIKKTAELTGFTERHVRNILNGENKKENETSKLILRTFIKITEGESKLLEEIKQSVVIPDNQKKQK